VSLKSNNKSPIARRMKEMRLQQGLSQKGLGIKAGMDIFTSSARINQYERDKHVPDYKTATILAKALDVPVTYLFTDDDDLADIILKYSKASKSQKAKIKSYISKL